MINIINSAKIFSTLGNNSSLIPIGIKDVSNSLGMTAGSYASGGKLEGKDRFIDEIGTQAIWLGGIPFFKKIIDLTVYKAAKLNSNVDVRVLKDKDIFEAAKKHAKDLDEDGLIQKSMEKIGGKEKLFKNLYISKFAIATLLTLGSYSALTTFRHKHTEKEVAKEILREEAEKKAQQKVQQGAQQKGNEKIQKNPSFGANLKMLNDFMFDPVKNLMLVDGGITTERLSESRSPQDFMGYVIKEGGFWLFMYFAGKKIQDGIENFCKKKFNKSIDLDIRVLQNEKFQKAFVSGDIQKHLDNFNKFKDEKDVVFYEKMFEEGSKDNMVFDVAKQSDIIKTYKKTGKIDTQQFVDIKEIKNTHKKMTELFEQYTKSIANGETAEKFFGKVKNLKRMSVVGNMGACVTALGIIIPGIMVISRKMDKDNKEFQVKTAMKEKMKKQNFQGVM